MTVKRVTGFFLYDCQIHQFLCIKFFFLRYMVVDNNNNVHGRI